MNATRTFLLAALRSGLECQILTPEGILRHLTPEVLAAHLPVALKARLLSASLKADRLNPALLIEIVEVEGLAEHLPEPLLWKCIAEAAERSLGGKEMVSGKPRGAAPATIFRGGSSDKVARAAAASRRPNLSRRPTRLTGATTAGRSNMGMDAHTDDAADTWNAPTSKPASDTDAVESEGGELAEWADEHTAAGEPAHQRKR